MKYLFLFGVYFSWWGGNIGLAQGHMAPDSQLPIRVERRYHPGGHQLAQKFAYYVDHWSERKVRHGRLSLWNAEGTLIHVAYYQHDTLSGPSEVYYSNGQLKTRLFFHQGVLDGPALAYDPGGRLKWKGTFREGLRHGTFVWYRRNGAEKKRKTFIHGVRQSDV